MKACCWYGTEDIRVEDVPDPKVLSPHDIVLRITSTAICGSDLHMYDGYIPTMKKGDILGHEFMGVVVAAGRDVKKVAEGDRVAIPFNIACGGCYFCNRSLHSLCDNSNPNAGMQEKITGYATSALFGYSHLYGGYAGGQAQMARVPYGDVAACKIPDGVPDEQVLFLTDIFPTGYMAAENCNIQPGDTVAVWGCGPVGQFAIRSAFLLGAERVVAIDRVGFRLRMAAEAGAETIDFEEADVKETLDSLTGGRGPDSCIDAVGMEAHGMGLSGFYDKAKQGMRLSFDRPYVLRQMVQCCRKGGTLSIPGVYIGFIDKFPMGNAFAKGLTFKMGQTHTHRYMRPLLEKVMEGKIDPSFVITHRIPLDEAPEGYSMFRDKEDECMKVILST